MAVVSLPSEDSPPTASSCLCNEAHADKVTGVSASWCHTLGLLANDKVCSRSPRDCVEPPKNPKLIMLKQQDTVDTTSPYPRSQVSPAFTSRPPDVTHMISVPRPSTLFATLNSTSVYANRRTKTREAWE